MFSNYFFLKRLASALEKKLVGLTLIECFSQNKDELIIGFASESREFWIKANLDPNISVISFPDTVARARKNSVDLFTSLKSGVALNCKVFQFERSFEINFESGSSLIFKMHGRRANILLHDKDGIKEIFRNSLSNDLDLNPESLGKHIEISEPAFLAHDCTPLDMIPALGKELQSYWDNNFSELENHQKWLEFQKLLSQLETNPISLDETNVTLSLLPVKGATLTLDPIEASNWLYSKKTRGFYFEREKAQVKNKLKQLIRKSENYIFKTSEKLRVIQTQRNPEEIANILMANLSLIEKGLSKVVLNDFYSSDFIEIKLNPKLSPQKNAENFYRKSKNRHQEIDSLEKNIQEKREKIAALNQLVESLESIQNSKELKKFLKSNKLEISSGKSQKNKSYHEFEKDTWNILVGKNAKANDELTLKVATKNDLWLHAKDVSGSHVVIKEKPGQNFPHHVIEYAAALAASNSKRKTDSVCPVIYTKKKFVRKPKGSLPGAVIVEKEEVIMVKPNENL